MKRGRPSKITVAEVAQAFAAMAANGKNTRNTAQKKLSVIRSIARKHLESLGEDASNDALSKLDLRQVFKRQDFNECMIRFFPNMSTRASNLGSIVSCIDAFGHGAFGLSDEAYMNIKKSMVATRSDVTVQREKCECPPEKVVRFEQLLDAEKQLAETEYGSDKHLALAVCVLVPPRRGDLSTLQFVTEAQPPEAAGNYCIIGDDAVTLDIRQFKTEKSYGPFVMSLITPEPRYAKFMEDPQKLAAILRHRYDAVGESYVFPDGNGYADRTQRYLQTLKEAIKQTTGLYLGIQAVRRAHATYKDNTTCSLEELRDLAYMRGHSAEIARTYVQADVLREKASHDSAENREATATENREVQTDPFEPETAPPSDDGYHEIASDLLVDVAEQAASIATALVPLAKRDDTARMVLGWLVTLQDDVAKISDVIGSRSIAALFSEANDSNV